MIRPVGMAGRWLAGTDDVAAYAALQALFGLKNEILPGRCTSADQKGKIEILMKDENINAHTRRILTGILVGL